MAKKPTKAEMWRQIKAKLTNEDEKSFIDHELELLAKGKGGSTKPTAKQVENEGIKERILATLADSKMTIAKLVKSVPDLPDDFQNQRMSALVHQLVVDNKVVREVEKGRAYFSLSAEAGE